MDLKILSVILMYWTLWTMLCVLVIFPALPTYGLTNSGNLSGLNVTDEPTSNPLSTVGNFFNFWLIWNFGIGIGTGAPGWVNVLIMLWQTAFSIFTVGFVLSAFWNG
jgi:hypothetical protein